MWHKLLLQVMCTKSWPWLLVELNLAAVVSGLRWFQLYVLKDRAFTASLVRRAVKAGFRALVVTVDRPVLGTQRLCSRCI